MYRDNEGETQREKKTEEKKSKYTIDTRRLAHSVLKRGRGKGGEGAGVGKGKEAR